MTPGPTHPNVEARQYRTLNPHATSTRVPDIVLCGAVGSVERERAHHGREQNSGPHGGRAQEVVRARDHCLSIPYGRDVLRGTQLRRDRSVRPVR